MATINLKSNQFNFLFLFFSLMSFESVLKAAEVDHSKHKMEGAQKSSSSNEVGIVIHHQHETGKWMFGYKYMSMYMDGLIQGTSVREGDAKVSSKEISRAMMGSPPTAIANFEYLMAPEDMTMQMHMLMGMYGYSEKISLMVMTNYIQNDMNMVMHMGNATTIMNTMYSQMATSGIGDTYLTAMINSSDDWTISFGMSLPTGSIDEKVFMNGNSIQGPYNMQLGSGTLDFQQSVTYSMIDGSWDWGAQESFTYRNGANSNGYILGNIFEVSAWVRKTYSNQLSIIARASIFDQGEIEGRDAKILNPKMSPTFDAVNSGKHQSDIALGITKSFNNGNSFGFEYSKPITQVVNGIQMETQYKYTLSWSYQM